MARISVKLAPKASRDGLAGWMGGTLKAMVTAAPERGRANEALVELLAEALDLPKSRIRVVRGETSRLKEVEIETLPLGEILKRLGAPGG